MTPRNSGSKYETIFLHDISAELERQLRLRAQANGRDPSAEASEIIERHLEESEDFGG
jgi:predicted DNA-binding protein